jgi:hypothetical protein
MGPGYNALPPGWVFDFFHWLVIVACFAPFVLVLCLFGARFVQLCTQRGPCCPSCGQPYRKGT